MWNKGVPLENKGVARLLFKENKRACPTYQVCIGRESIPTVTHTWRGDFGQKVLDTVNFLIEENQVVLYTKALVAEQMATYLQKVPVWPGSDLHKYAYQYSEWDPETNNPQLDVSVLLYANDFFDYRLIRHLVLIRLSYEHSHWRIWLHSMEMTTLHKRDQSAHSF